MTKTYLIAARRSPVVPRNGALAHLSIEEIAKPVLLQLLRDAAISPADIGELVVSNALGAGGNPARIIALHAGLPDRVAGLSIDRQCAGGLDALVLADAMIRSGQHHVVIAGGVESYSRRPLRYQTFADGRDPAPYDQACFTPWADRDPDMALAADRLAQKLGISKAEQDAWAIESHAKALVGVHPEIVPVEGIGGDAFTRNLSARLCDKAPVVVGSITAANMAVAADGAGFVVLASEKYIADHGIDTVEFVAGKTLGDDPVLPGIAPVKAINAVLDMAGVKVDDLISAEIMEAFAIQAIACQQGANLPVEVVNRHGGALAWGHPIGASGAILAARLFHQLLRTKGTGVAAIASAGGLGSAVVLRSD
ncbi:thiolase family protein [Yoonia maritima]|uniref:thiolase family protein n=1 Tax=Yoonia maritima TaxID=1435347 RepID=UPI000D0FE8D1|nr:thiolase family protein [Yoonia maritima]